MKKLGKFPVRLWFTSLCASALVACGGGGGNSPSATNPPATGGSNANQAAKVTYPDDDNDARRFLTQATFGPTDDDVADLNTRGFEPWIDAQLAQKQTRTHTAYYDYRDGLVKTANPNSMANFNEVVQSFWYSALNSKDQLRQRVAFALSEIFIVSGVDGCGANAPRAVASYYDMLADNAFGSYRNLLEKVALHPVMGCYLSHLRNQRENSVTGRVPDENFAREIMQLFSIGLYQLNPDGSNKKNPDGSVVETYTPADVAGLAKVFTGLSFDCPDWPSDSCFYWGQKDGVRYDDYWSRPMVGYPQFHSYTSDKSFLGNTIKAADRPDPLSDVKQALDWIALTHPNVGPFIGRQLIQRLVTSNPTPAYIARVTEAFESSGRKLGAMIKAILLDPEARNLKYALANENNYGKVREPILKLSAYLRAVGAVSDSGDYVIDATDDTGTLSQSPLKSPTVFNFFRPGYVFPGGSSAAANLVAPELQIANESSLAGYANYMKNVIQYGVGRTMTNSDGISRNDIQMPYNLSQSNFWYQLASKQDSGDLLSSINDRLMYGTMSDSLRVELKSAVESIALSNPPQSSQVRNRLYSAMLLTVASPEFQVQK